MMWVECCERCKKAKVSIDHVARKKRCSECGLESDYHSIKDGDDVAKNDSVRLGDLTNPLLSKTGLSIGTTEPKNGSSDDLLSLTLGNSVAIAAMSNRLGLPTTVMNKANECFKKVEAYYNKGKSRNVLFAGCIYIACRGYSDMTRSVGEISSVANGATISEILQAIEFVAEKLNIDIKPVDFIKLFGSNLGMDSIEVKVAQIAAGSYECGGRSPVSVAAGFVYAFARRSYEKKLLKEIGEATGVSAETIRETYKDLYPSVN